MSTQASITSATTSTDHQTFSSTAWFWWKETRQLAPLVGLLIAVASLIVISGNLMTSIFRWMSSGMLSEAAVLIFPGLFATGAGPLLVGQERALRTMDWLVLLPISAKRLVLTKFLVALCGLVVMWLFSIALLGLVAPDSQAWRWTLGESMAYSSIPFSGAMGFPLFMMHSVFVLVVGFYVAWRISNQFYSLIALVPLAFAPFIATSIIAELNDRPLPPGTLEWINFGFACLGIAIVTPLAYRAAMKALAPAPAPPLQSLFPHGAVSPAKPIADATPPRFGTRLAPVIWQSYHSARGMLAILVGMLIVAWLSAIFLVSVERLRGIAGFLPLLLVAAPLAICWAGVAVFKHDGATERIRFLADRGISHRVVYCGLHAIPFGLVTGSVLVYGFWNLFFTHRESTSNFAHSLPTLIPTLYFALLIYSISQWVSQMMRTMILAVILAPILSLMICSWLGFSFVALGFPGWGLATCVVVPLLATAFPMRRYADGTDRPLTFIVGAVALLLITLLPLACAAWQVHQIPAIQGQQRTDLLSQAQQLRSDQTQSRWVPMPAYEPYQQDFSGVTLDPIEELEQSFERYQFDPNAVIERLSTTDDLPATLDHWQYARWHGEFLLHRRRWLQKDQAWSSFAPWLEASARLVPALRRSTLLADQKIADRLEVVLLDTLALPQLREHRTEPAVTVAADSIGTPHSRATARRRAALVTWSHLQEMDDDERFRHVGYLAIRKLDRVPPGLSDWMSPRIYDQFLLALFDGIEAAEKQSAEKEWRRDLHALHQAGGLLETSRYGDFMRSLPPMETMTIATNTGFGQLWGMDWEYTRPESLLADDEAAPSTDATKNPSGNR